MPNQREYHVSMTGNDAGAGHAASPLRTISAAAALAQPGDVILVHGGTYRERINPPRGGESEQTRIVYQAAKGEKVEIKGSEIIKGWEPVQGSVWKVVIPNHFFGEFNPYNDLISGDWFDSYNRDHHTGAVYLNGDCLIEAAALADVMDNQSASSLWYGQVDEQETTLWANFDKVNPNDELVEINVRQTVFYPEKPGINYISVSGFIMEHAATPWAPPTAEQIGLLGTHWSKGWIIENNVIRHSKCVGITLGKYGDEWDNAAATADAYNDTIKRALSNGWSVDHIGHHLVKGNTITHCEQAGIVGSLGAAFSVITKNHIHDIRVQRVFNGAEVAGIKIHAPIDTLVSENAIYRAERGVWFDWMTQGTRLTGNLLFDNDAQDLFVEVSHGPFIIDNNLFLSGHAHHVILNISEGGVYAHNLIRGAVFKMPDPFRQTPYHYAHTTEVAGLSNTVRGDDRLYNNIIIAAGNEDGLSKYNDETKLPMQIEGNVFLHGAKPSVLEQSPLVDEHFKANVKIEEADDGIYFTMHFDQNWRNAAPRKPVTSGLLGRTATSQLPFENPDGSELAIRTDYFGNLRDEGNPYPGPFELQNGGEYKIKLWPR